MQEGHIMPVSEKDKTKIEYGRDLLQKIVEKYGELQYPDLTKALKGLNSAIETGQNLGEAAQETYIAVQQLDEIHNKLCDAEYDLSDRGVDAGNAHTECLMSNKYSYGKALKAFQYEQYNSNTVMSNFVRKETKPAANLINDIGGTVKLMFSNDRASLRQIANYWLNVLK